MSEGWIPQASSRKVDYRVQQLARMVAYAFYGPEHGLIVDILAKHSSVKEDDLCELLKLEKKHFRNILQALKVDQIIASKQRITKDDKDVSLRSFEYGLDYSSLLNLVKYKLEMMRKKLDAEERTNANRASFSCTDCQKTFSDLEAGQLIDHATGNMFCTICGSEVTEAAAAPNESQHVATAKFNECLDSLYILLREIDELKLSPDELQSDFSAPSLDLAMAAAQSGNQGHWSSDRSRADYNYIPQSITINIGEVEVKQQKAREQPIWLTKSTIMADDEMAAATVETTVVKPGETSAKADEVLSMLMRHEKQVYEEELRPSTPPSVDRGCDDEMEDMDGDEEDDGVEEPKVRVGDMYYPLSQITSELAAQMTEEETEAYIRIGQDFHADYGLMY